VKEQRKASSKACDSESPSPNLASEPDKNHQVEELSKKMLSWSGLWFGSSGGSTPTAEEHRVRERLLDWLERCIGGQVRALLTSRVEDVSLANSAPLLTALLGRRAMLELSRRVLNDS
jgi:hypothetical protein